jgi:hypothetical protein
MLESQIDTVAPLVLAGAILAFVGGAAYRGRERAQER